MLFTVFSAKKSKNSRNPTQPTSCPTMDPSDTMIPMLSFLPPDTKNYFIFEQQRRESFKEWPFAATENCSITKVVYQNCVCIVEPFNLLYFDLAFCRWPKLDSTGAAWKRSRTARPVLCATNIWTIGSQRMIPGSSTSDMHPSALSLSWASRKLCWP